MAFPIPVELNTPLANRGGLLASAEALPNGWTRGISFQDKWCLTSVALGECPTGQGLKPTQRADSVTFRPVSLVSAVECSAMGDTDVTALSGQTLTDTESFTLARELLTGAASARDSGAAESNPSLVSEASSLGTLNDPVRAVACLETAFAEATGGRSGVILMPPAFADQTKSALWRDGNSWKTVSGNKVIIDSGFDGRSPDTAGDNSGALFIYITVAVWAGVGSRASYDDMNRADNTVNSRAEDITLAAFSPCSTFAIGVNDLACAPDSPTITYPLNGAVTGPYVPFRGRGCGPSEPVELWVEEPSSGQEHSVDSGTTNENGVFNFVGTQAIAAGTSEWWVVCGGEESDRITITVQS